MNSLKIDTFKNIVMNFILFYYFFIQRISFINCIGKKMKIFEKKQNV